MRSRVRLTLRLVFHLRAGRSLRVPHSRARHSERRVRRSKPLWRPETFRPISSPRLCARLAPISSGCLRATTPTRSSCRCSGTPRTGSWGSLSVLPADTRDDIKPDRPLPSSFIWGSACGHLRSRRAPSIRSLNVLSNSARDPPFVASRSGESVGIHGRPIRTTNGGLAVLFLSAV